MTLEQGLATAGIDFEVGCAPLRVLLDDNAVDVQPYQLTYRKDNHKPIAPVGARYHVVQTREAIKVADAMTLGGWTPTFAGALNGGRAVFIAGELDTKLVTGEVKPYLCFVNSFDGSSGLKFACTPIRLTCTNMVRAVFNRKHDARPVVSLRHTANVMARVEQAATVLGLTKGYYDYLDEQIERLLDTPLDRDVMDIALDTVAPLTDKGVLLTGRRLERRVEKRSRLVAHLNESPTLAGIRETAWGMYNAMTELEQWGRDEVTDRQAEQLFGSHLSITPVRNHSDRVYKQFDRLLSTN
jgi:phage/plasmid-like protein (TIGR03299 family)